MSSVLATRLRYGTVLVAVVVALFWADLHLWPSGPSSLVIALLALAAQAEFYGMAKGDGRSPSLPWGLGIGALWLAGVAFGFADANLLALAMMAYLFVSVLGRRPEGASDRAGITLLGVLAIPFLLSHMIALRALPEGWAWLIFVVAVAKAGDSMAFFVGSSMGKHKLIPEVSPNKSWEGAIASVAGAILAAAIVAGTCFTVAPSWEVWLPAAVVANVGAQFGDLSESLLKRSFRTKDSAGLLPAFGGTFDLVDSFLLAAPALHLYLLQTTLP